MGLILLCEVLLCEVFRVCGLMLVLIVCLVLSSSVVMVRIFEL